MNWRDLPSLNSLRAFAAVAETGSLSKAGTSLNVSHAAISQQVRGLETRLGVQLIEKQGRGIALTAQGLIFARDLTAGFETIAQAVSALSDEDTTRPLQVTMTPMFAVTWLMPRISDFRHQHPEIELMLNPTVEVVALAPGGVDIAIRASSGRWPGMISERLVDTDFVVVAATSLIGDRQINEPKDLLDLPWLQELGTNEVSRWLADQGVIVPERMSISHLPGYMVLEGLRNGDGVAATARAFVEPDVKAGRLRVLFENARNETGYYMVTRPGVMRPPLKAFVTWLKRQT